MSSPRRPLTTIRCSVVGDPSSSLSSVDSHSSKEKILLQPRVCTLRSYGSDAKRVSEPKSASPFLASLADYIDNSKKSSYFEIISGRLAMVVFAVTVGTEAVTGDSLFKKIDVVEFAEVIGICMVVVVCSAVFASMSSAKIGIGKQLMLGCNNFVDSFVDNIMDGLFFEDDDPRNWSDDV